MKKAALLSITLLGLTACSQGVTTMTDRSQSPCGDTVSYTHLTLPTT